MIRRECCVCCPFYPGVALAIYPGVALAIYPGVTLVIFAIYPGWRVDWDEAGALSSSPGRLVRVMRNTALSTCTTMDGLSHAIVGIPGTRRASPLARAVVLADAPEDYGR